MKVEVAIGEVFDKITILDIKLERIKDEKRKENIRRERQILSDALDKLMNLCKNVDSVEYKKFLEIFQSKEHLDWGIENTGQHGVGTPNPARIMSTYNWSLKNYPPLKEFFNIGLDK